MKDEGGIGWDLEEGIGLFGGLGGEMEVGEMFILGVDNFGRH